MNLLKLIALFFIFSFLGQACENIDQKELAPTKISSYQVDRKILVEILKDHQDDNSVFDPRYKHFGDKIIDYVKDQGKDPGFLPSHLQTYLDQETLNLPHITWMSIQAAFILTPPEQRIRKLSDWVEKTINQLLEKVRFKGNKPNWTLFTSQKPSFLSSLDYYHNEVAFIPVIGTDIYDPRFFLKCVADNIYPISLAVSKFGAHGGIYKTPIELILHDIAHIAGRFEIHDYDIHLNNSDSQHPKISFVNNNDSFWGVPKKTSLSSTVFKSSLFNFLIIKPWLKAYATLAKRVVPLISEDNTQFSKEEKNKLLTFFFYALQEVEYEFVATGNMLKYNNENYQKLNSSFQFPSKNLPDLKEIFTQYQAGTFIPKDVCLKNALNCLIENFEQAVINHYPDTFNSLETYYARPEIFKYLEQRYSKPQIKIKYKSFEPDANQPYTDLATYQVDDQEKIEKFRGNRHYEYSKKFHRDVVYLLAQTGLHPKISKPLGIDYPVTQVRETLLDLHTWILEELKPEGRLYPYFKD